VTNLDLGGFVNHSSWAANELLKTISTMPDNVIEIILGDFGKKIRNFSNVIDLDHPDLPKILGDSTPILESIVKLSKYFSENEYPYLKQEYHKLLPSKIIKQLGHLDDPKENLQFIRLVKSEKVRKVLRKNKVPQFIRFGVTTKKDDSIWNNQPSNFNVYKRNSVEYLEECNKIKKKAERYKQLGCESLYQEMIKGIVEYESQFVDNHYGFNRITMTNAALILAKISGYSCSEFNNEFIIHKKIANELKIYSPLAFPLCESSVRFKRIFEFVDCLEHFPEASGKSIFDHYIVLIPSFSSAEFEKGELKLGSTLDYCENNDCIPILIGEANNKCYFVGN
jgi:hypothetical protein